MPAKDGVRKYTDGRRSDSSTGMMVYKKGPSKALLYFTITKGSRVCELWDEKNGREVVEMIPPEVAQLEESVLRACTAGDQSNLDAALARCPALAKHARDTESNKRAPCLVVAAAHGHDSLVSHVLGSGAEPDAADAEMQNAFHAASFFGHKEVLRVLISYTRSGSCVKDALFAMDAQCTSGKTPLQMAVEAHKQHVTDSEEVRTHTHTHSHHPNFFFSSLSLSLSHTHRHSR